MSWQTASASHSQEVPPAGCLSTGRTTLWVLFFIYKMDRTQCVPTAGSKFWGGDHIILGDIYRGGQQ